MVAALTLGALLVAGLAVGCLGQTEESTDGGGSPGESGAPDTVTDQMDTDAPPEVDASGAASRSGGLT